jgi:hypothetical protein
LAFDRLRALLLLSECTGDDIWSLEHCRSRGVPQVWIDDLQDCFESSFERDSDTIYVGDHKTNQYHGVRDVDLALRLGEYLGIDVHQLQSQSATRNGLVRNIQEAVEES